MTAERLERAICTAKRAEPVPGLFVPHQAWAPVFQERRRESRDGGGEWEGERQTDRQAGKQTDRERERETKRQRGRQTTKERQTDRRKFWK